jgi:hypothetical protein
MASDHGRLSTLIGNNENTLVETSGADSSKKSLADQMKDAFPSKLQWTSNEPTGIPFHNTGCTVCVDYIHHVLKARHEGDLHLLGALEKAYDVHVDRYLRSAEFHERMTAQYDAGADDAKASTRSKAKARATEEFLNLQDENDRLRADLDKLKVELQERDTTIKRLSTENEDLSAKYEMAIHAISDNHVEADYIPLDVPFTAGAQASARSLSYSGVVKTPPKSISHVSTQKRSLDRSLNESRSTKSKKRQRVELRDASTGLPVPLGGGDGPRLPNGAWAKTFGIAQPREIIARIDKMATRRDKPEWLDLFNEVVQLRELAPNSLGNTQRYLLKKHAEPRTPFEECLLNPENAAPGIRWENNLPVKEDVETWTLVRHLLRTKGSNKATLREHLLNAVKDTTYWERKPPPKLTYTTRECREWTYTQEAPPSVTTMRHHMLRCGIDPEYVRKQLRPYLTRQEDEPQKAPDSVIAEARRRRASVPLERIQRKQMLAQASRADQWERQIEHALIFGHPGCVEPMSSTLGRPSTPTIEPFTIGELPVRTKKQKPKASVKSIPTRVESPATQPPSTPEPGLLAENTDEENVVDSGDQTGTSIVDARIDDVDMEDAVSLGEDPTPI